MPLPSPETVAARTRAALAYANIKLTDKGEPVSVGAISQPTMARIISPTNPRGVKSLEELWAIADACGVPRAFMEEGFSEPAAADDSRVAGLERKMEAVEVLLPLLLEGIELARGQKTDPSVLRLLEQMHEQTA